MDGVSQFFDVDSVSERVDSGVMIQINKDLQILKDIDRNANENYLYLRELRPDFQASQKVLRVLMLDWTEKVITMDDSEALYKLILSSEEIYKYTPNTTTVISKADMFSHSRPRYEEAIYFVTQNYLSSFIKGYQEDSNNKQEAYREVIKSLFMQLVVHFFLWTSLCVFFVILFMPSVTNVYRQAFQVFSAFAMLTPDEITDFVKSASLFNDLYLQDLKHRSPVSEDPEGYGIDSEESYDYGRNMSTAKHYNNSNKIDVVGAFARSSAHYLQLNDRNSKGQGAGSNKKEKDRKMILIPAFNDTISITHKPDPIPSHESKNPPPAQPPQHNDMNISFQQEVTPENQIPMPSRTSQDQSSLDKMVAAATRQVFSEINELHTLKDVGSPRQTRNTENDYKEVVETDHQRLIDAIALGSYQLSKKDKRKIKKASEDDDGISREDILRSYRERFIIGVFKRAGIGSIIFFPWCIINFVIDWLSFNQGERMLKHQQLILDLNWMIPHLNTVIADVMANKTAEKMPAGFPGQGELVYEYYTNQIYETVQKINQLQPLNAIHFDEYNAEFEEIMTTDLCSSFFNQQLPDRLRAVDIGKPPSSQMKILIYTG